MSRYATSSSYRHRVRRIGPDHYRLSWVTDRYYPGSTLRHPLASARDTDIKGARAFVRRWKLSPIEPEPVA